ncbi:MAG: type IV toxin-antitoxin system AbiEi family antitoxin domain-containing protein [Rhodococcus sp. (in: high G+C Gram-positive bacteria)]|uniref:type IV toxin-antitoxin system AbiEi family antitoxin domain-containing protein n=1 Tax=Rhodococcus sp. TaxID=1831 RepID=UPI003BAF9272
MRGDSRILDLADLAAGQWGLFTTAQAKTLGFTAQRIARLADHGAIERLRHGAYRIAGAPSAPDEQLRVAWLMIEPAVTAGERLDAEYPAVVSHCSAARLHRLGDVDADVMEFTTARRKQSRLGDIRYRVASLDRGRWTLVDGLPATTVLATIADLAADQLDGGHLAAIVRDAVTTGGADTDAVITALRPYAHRYGVALGDGSGLLGG